MKDHRLAKTGLMAVMVVLVLAGCNRSISSIETRSPPQPLPSTPLEPVETTQLDPATNGLQDGPAPIAGDVSSGDQLASVEGDPNAPQTLEPAEPGISHGCAFGTNRTQHLA